MISVFVGSSGSPGVVFRRRDAGVALGGRNNNNRARCCPASITQPSGPCGLTSPGEYSPPALRRKSPQEPPRWTRTRTRTRRSRSRSVGRGAWPASSPGCRAPKPARCSSGSRTPSGEEASTDPCCFSFKQQQQQQVPPGFK